MDAIGNISGYLYSSTGVISGYTVNTGLFVKPSQKIITPNGDGINDTIVFTGLGTTFEIDIFNINGKLINKITDKNYWDGTDYNNKLVENGIYIYQIKNNNQKIEGTILVVK